MREMHGYEIRTSQETQNTRARKRNGKHSLLVCLGPTNVARRLATQLRVPVGFVWRARRLVQCGFCVRRAQLLGCSRRIRPLEDLLYDSKALLASYPRILVPLVDILARADLWAFQTVFVHRQCCHSVYRSRAVRRATWGFEALRRVSCWMGGLRSWC